MRVHTLPCPPGPPPSGASANSHPPGILLGPSGLGQRYPCPTGSTAKTSLYPNGAPCDERNPTLLLFPTYAPFQNGPSNIRNYLNVCAQLGVIVFMFVVGLEVDIPKLRRTSGKATSIAFFSVAVPFLLGTFTLGPYLHSAHSKVTTSNGVVHAVDALSFELFVGTCMSVTAFPVLARIITEKKLQKLQLGSMTLACAALNDVVAWALLAVVLAVQKSSTTGGGVSFKPVLKELGLIIIVVLVSWLVVSPLMRFTVFNHYKRTGSLSPNRLAWVLVGMFLTAWLVHHIGFHAMLGSFTFGLVFPRGAGTPFIYSLLGKVESFASVVLLPIFFVVTGLSVDLSALNGPGVGLELLYILLVAAGGKLLGSGIVARLSGLNFRHSLAVGVMMNTRGLTEIVVLNIAKQALILDDVIFTLLILMAIITTVVAGPALTLTFPPKQLVKERAAEMHAAALSRGKSVKAGDAQLVVYVHDLKSVPRLLDAAVCTLPPAIRAHLDVCHYTLPGILSEPSEMGTGLQRSPEETIVESAIREHLSSVVRKGLTSRVTVATTTHPVDDALVHLHALQPQLLVTDWPEDEAERERLLDLVVAAPCTVVMWGGGGGRARKQQAAAAKAAAESLLAGVPPPVVMVPPMSPLPADGQSTSAVAAQASMRLSRLASGNSGSSPLMPSASTESITSTHGAEDTWGPGSPSPNTTAEAQHHHLHRRTASDLPLQLEPAPPGTPYLRRLLRDERLQDEAVDAGMAWIWRSIETMQVKMVAALPARLRPDAGGNILSDAEEDEEEEDEGGHSMAMTTRITVKGADSGVVTPETMAVAAASSLSPVSLKVVVTGWPESPAECAKLVAFIQNVETQLAARRENARMSRDGGPGSVGGLGSGSFSVHGASGPGSRRQSLDVMERGLSASLSGTPKGSFKAVEPHDMVSAEVSAQLMAINEVSLDVRIVDPKRTPGFEALKLAMMSKLEEGKEGEEGGSPPPSTKRI